MNKNTPAYPELGNVAYKSDWDLNVGPTFHARATVDVVCALVNTGMYNNYVEKELAEMAVKIVDAVFEALNKEEK